MQVRTIRTQYASLGVAGFFPIEECGDTRRATNRILFMFRLGDYLCIYIPRPHLEKGKKKIADVGCDGSCWVLVHIPSARQQNRHVEEQPMDVSDTRYLPLDVISRNIRRCMASRAEV